MVRSLGRPPGEMAPAFTCSAIVRVGSHSCRGRYLPPTERAKLWTEGGTADSGDQVDAFDLVQVLYFLLQRRLFLQDGADGQLEDPATLGLKAVLGRL